MTVLARMSGNAAITPAQAQLITEQLSAVLNDDLDVYGPLVARTATQTPPAGLLLTALTEATSTAPRENLQGLSNSLPEASVALAEIAEHITTRLVTLHLALATKDPPSPPTSPTR